jgi:hypothetical protein
MHNLDAVGVEWVVGPVLMEYQFQDVRGPVHSR